MKVELYKIIDKTHPNYGDVFLGIAETIHDMQFIKDCRHSKQYILANKCKKIKK
jgi:hypothetical protein